MYPPAAETMKNANEQAIFNVYMYLTDKATPIEGEPLRAIIAQLDNAFVTTGAVGWDNRDIYRLHMLKNAVSGNATLADAKIGDFTRSKSGMTACTFTKPNGETAVVFRGAGDGEWIDNGEGLSGIPEQNTYVTYGKRGEIVSFETVKNDYATDQQAEALNWFSAIAAKNGWNTHSNITVSGHSKGGNKAQFVALHTDLTHTCYSFDGQGFSPEALRAFEKQGGVDFERRRQRIFSFSAENDYVNVLGERLAPKEHIYFFESFMGLHHMEAILDTSGRLRPQCEQGALSRYIQEVSGKLMRLKPALRQYATLGVMNIFQKYLGEGLPVNGDAVSVEKTVAGLTLAIGVLLDTIGLR